MNKKNILLSAIALVFFVSITLVIINHKGNKRHKVNPAFKQYISAFTAGIISTESSIKIRLATDFNDTTAIQAKKFSELFSFSPSLKGEVSWIDSRTIQFKPSKKLPAGETFEGKFYISKILDVPDSLRTFEFDFQTIKQAIEVETENLKPYENQDEKMNKLTGVLRTADVANSKDVEKALMAIQKSENLKISWIHDEDRKTHHFQVDSIERKDKAYFLELKWNGNNIDCDQKGNIDVEVPAIEDYRLVSAKVVSSPDQCLVLQFTDLIQPDQVLDGLIKVGDLMNLKYIIEDNEIRVYPESKQSGKLLVTIEPSIKNVKGKSLSKKVAREVIFEDVKPAIRLLGKGVIIPRSNGLIFPFEAVNLKAVDVKIIKIYENNITQFLQVNDLNGESELRRVGKMVLKKTVSLISKDIVNYGKWNKFSLDLAELIKAEPGAIYQVSLSIKKEYSFYPCDGGVEDENLVAFDNEDGDEESNDWDYYGDNYYDYDDYYYDWSERDNPCNPSYYSSKKVSRNVLASDIGIIAKKGNSGSMVFYLTDIVTTKPMSKVDIELYDYQKQVICKLKTDDQGIARADLKKSPFLLVAKKGDQRGYLKLEDGSSLSLSMFDVSGETVKKGIKGFIYGERGVWRPGDSLYLTFILEDKLKKLPENHPVTFDLVNPQGQIVKHYSKTKSINGFYDFRTATEGNAPTGNYNAKVKVGGITFSKQIKIETIMPNRLKINLDFASDKLVKDAKKQGSLDVKWLHGAVAKNLTADVSVVLNQSKTEFKNFKGFVFDDPARTFYSESHNIFNGKLDANGKANVKADINTSNAAPGVLTANFQTRVFEQGGAFSIDRFSMPYYPYNSYVGIKVPQGNQLTGMLYTDTNNTINIVNVDVNGNLKLKSKLKVEVYKVEWRWWWDNSGESLSNFVGSTYNLPISTQELNTVNGTAKFNLRVNYPDWGRYLVRVTDVESGHCTGDVIYLDWPGWMGKSREGNQTTATMLAFSSDKAKYNVGDMVNLTIPSGPDGRALVSIETGTKVLNSYWVDTKKGFTNFSFKVSADMAPNIYAHVTLLQPHAQTKNDLPIRMYGVIPIQIEDPNTHLRPLIKMADVLKPEQLASISVKEENGKAMTYTIAVVDEGLLDLTRFKTPDPWTNFYAREALGVKTWDIFDYVMGAYGGDLERILSIGGGDEGGSGGKKGSAKANRFKPMVKFFGPFSCKPGELKTHKFIVPQYLGSVRVMVVAGNNGAYGNTEKTVAVRKPVMVLGTLPRVVGPGETLKLPVNVFAMEKFVKNVNVQVTTNQLISVVGGSTKQIYFAKPGEEFINFDLKVNSGIGVGKVKIVATSGAEKSVYDVEIDVRNPNPKVIDVVETAIGPGKTWNTTYLPVGMNGTNRGTIELSSIPPINLDKRLKYLIEYPHGCIEQTTSSVFPQLFVSTLTDLNQLQKADIERNVKAGIARIKSFQLSNGGLSYWQGEPTADDWGTSYAGHFMIKAQEKGYSIPMGFIDSWKKYQKQKALSWNGSSDTYNSDLLQAYRLYTLALAKAPELGAMNRLREQKNLSSTTKWRLAAAYQLSGQTSVAQKLAFTATTEVKKYRELYYTYGSNERDEAMILEALCLMKLNSKAASMFKVVAASLSKNAWMSTQSTSFSLIAISEFLKNNGTSKGINCSYKLNSATLTNLISKNFVSQISMGLNGKSNKGNLQVKNNSNSVLFARIILEGIPETGDNTKAENDLKLKVVFKTVKGDKIDPEKIDQGTDFIAEVTVSNPGLKGDYKQIALTQIFPSGWEIHNTRMDNFENNFLSSVAEYQNFRDDRVYSYFSLNSNQSKTFRILLNASYAGKFYLPTTYVEAMYDQSINARMPGKWIQVVVPKDGAVIAQK
ncbi:MAG: hypothetical protein HXX09_11910 [Bacteroidetes bacterium]|nr:hypothetical protein [Bacteroidota bacterium]